MLNISSLFVQSFSVNSANFSLEIVDNCCMKRIITHGSLSNCLYSYIEPVRIAEHLFVNILLEWSNGDCWSRMERWISCHYQCSNSFQPPTHTNHPLTICAPICHSSVVNSGMPVHQQMNERVPKRTSSCHAKTTGLQQSADT